MPVLQSTDCIKGAVSHCRPFCLWRREKGYDTLIFWDSLRNRATIFIKIPCGSHFYSRLDLATHCQWLNSHDSGRREQVKVTATWMKFIAQFSLASGRIQEPIPYGSVPDFFPFIKKGKVLATRDYCMGTNFRGS